MIPAGRSSGHADSSVAISASITASRPGAISWARAALAASNLRQLATDRLLARLNV
jgi:hypothetical protein